MQAAFSWIKRNYKTGYSEMTSTTEISLRPGAAVWRFAKDQRI